MSNLVQRQREFLDKGVQYIKPMSSRTAEDMGGPFDHLARRNRKYAHTPQGVIELAASSRGMRNEEGARSQRAPQVKIKKLRRRGRTTPSHDRWSRLCESG